MDSVRARLIDRQARLLLLLAPPFDKSDQDPGYIKGYPPGIRENGGQYTHAAVWALMAVAKSGNGDEAAELFHMLNPINHTRTPEAVAKYRTEPYVLDGDVYARPPHAGRGGWSWYTGLGGLALSRRPRAHPRPARPRRSLHDEPVRAVIVDQLLDHVEASRLDVSDRSLKSRSRVDRRAEGGDGWPARRSPLDTARRTTAATHMVKITMGRQDVTGT